MRVTTLVIKGLILACFGLIVLAQLQGCALTPNYIEPEIEHMSHATQHEPLTNHPTEYGAEIASVVVGWEWFAGKSQNTFSLELAEGIALEKHYPAQNGFAESTGEIAGPREQFSGRIGYKFRLKP